MKEAGHTQGPWKTWEHPDHCERGDETHCIFTGFIRTANGALGYARGGRHDHDDQAWVMTRADANLIAAAPELLEACEAALFRLEQTCHCEYAEMVDLRAAIAKAKGQA